MKKAIALILAALLVLSMLTAFAAEHTDKDTVKKVQQALNDAGYNCGTPDGAAGKKTKAAIMEYQAANGLEQTGVIDDALLAALGLAETDEAEIAAEDGEKEITFQGVPWETKCEDLGKALKKAGFILVDEQNFIEFVFGTIKDNVTGGFMLRHNDELIFAPLDASEYSAVISNIGHGNTTYSDGRKGLNQIAGYDVESWLVNFILTDGTAFPILYQITLEAGDKDAAYEDLRAKLTTVYGESEHGESKTGWESTDVWQGANNTAVVLYAHLSGGKILDLSLCYGKTDAEAVAAAAMGQLAPNNGVDSSDTSGL